MRAYFKYYLAITLEYKRLNCEETVPSSELNVVASLCKLLDMFATKENGLDPNNEDQFDDMSKLWFLFWYFYTFLAGSIASINRRNF